MLVLIVNPAGGGSGKCARQIVDDLEGHGHTVKMSSSLNKFGLSALLIADLIILNEGLQGARRRDLALIKIFGKRTVRIYLIVRNFRFPLAHFSKLGNLVDRFYCVSKSLRDLFTLIFHDKLDLTRLLIEPSIVSELPGLKREGFAIPKTVVVPRAYLHQHAVLLDVAHELVSLGHSVSVVDHIDSKALQSNTKPELPTFTKIPFQPSLTDLYSYGDAVLMGGSLPDGWGLIYNESIMFGKFPLVIADSGGYVEQYLRSQIGILTGISNPKTMAKSFSNFLLGTDDADYNKLLVARDNILLYGDTFSYSKAFEIDNA